MERVPEGVARFHPRPEHEDNFYRVTRFKDQNDKVVPVSIAFKSSGAFCRQISCLRFQSRFGRNLLQQLTDSPAIKLITSANGL
jgi:hypothetical protein